MNQENKIGKILPADKIIFFGTGDKYGTEVMRITRDGVWVNPDVAVDDTAKAVLQAISGYVEVLVQRAVVDEREKVKHELLTLEKWKGMALAKDGDGRTVQEIQREAREAEREKVAAWMMQRGYATGHGDTTEDLLQELDWQIAENWNRALINGVETEREECAKLLDEMAAADRLSNYYKVAALRIRERGAP